MNSNLEAVQALARERITMTEEELLGTARELPRQPVSPNGAATPSAAAPDQQPRPQWENSTPVQLTPSDLIFLERIPFVDGRLNRDQSLSLSKEAVETALAMAVLANEEAGAIRLHVERTKYFFGLFTNKQLRTVRTGKGSQWPTTSLESDMYSRRGRPVSEIIYDWLGKNSTTPRRDAELLILDRMATRGLLNKEVDVVAKKWLCFSSQKTKTHYVIPEPTAAEVARQPEGRSGRLLMECQKNRPEVYELLMGEIGSAFSKRTISSEGD